MGLDAKRALDTRRSIVVEACAGSGKTWLLSSRITRALLEGVAPGSILALTFTTKAAAEMRNRVIRQLRDLAHGDAAARREMLLAWGFEHEALELAMQAAPGALARFLADPRPPIIGTFHSWYLRLVAMAPMRAAGWATLSLSQRPWDLLRQAWQMFYAEHAERLPYAALVAQMGTTRVRQAMESWLSSRVEWQAFSADSIGRAARDSDLNRLLSDAEQANAQAIAEFYRAHQEQAGFLAQAYRDIEDRQALAEEFQRWDPLAIESLRAMLFTEKKAADILAADSPERFHFKGGNDRFVRKGKDLGVWGARGPHIKEQVMQLGRGLMGLLDACDERRVQARTQALWACAQCLGQCLEEIMSRGHETDFAGLETKAWELLGGALAADFHARLDARFEHILVDEFQDTNPVQWAMLRGWLDQYTQDDQSIRQKAPRVFIVGDPKQSIYRFRRADPEVFHAAARWLEQHYGAELLTTNTTYRCGQPVVDFLNVAMTALAPARFTAHDTRAASDNGFVARLPLAPDWESEGRGIADALACLRRESPELQWSDMRILVRTRTHMADYESALAQAGIPFVSDRSGGLLSEPEILDLIALLRFLAFPWSDLDCAQALKSPLFGVSDAELAEIAMHAPSGASRSLFERLTDLARSPAGESFAAIAQTLSRWIEWSTQLPVHDLLDRVLHDQDYFDRIASRYGGCRSLQRLANIEAFVGLALELDTGRLPSLPRFLRELTRWSQVRDADAPGPGVLPNQQAVLLSTLHGAKGLEAKVVVLAGLMDQERTDTGIRWLSEWTESRDAIARIATWSSGDPMSETVRAALLDEQRRADEEDFNLLYVGFTRAKQFLLLSAAGKERAGEGRLKWFEKVRDFCDERRFDPAGPLLGSDTSDSINVVSASSVSWRGLRFAKRTSDQSEQPVVDTIPMRQGKALHRLLELGPALHERLMAPLIAEFGLPASARDEVIASARRIATTAHARLIFDPALTAYAEAEWPMQNVAAGALLMRPDRVIRVRQSPEEWWIIDFKWRVLESEQADYVRQLTGYQEQFARIRPQAKICAKILTASAQLWDLQQGRLVHLD